MDIAQDFACGKLDPISRPAACWLLQLMEFRALQDNLRRLLQERIAAGELTGLQLAHQAGFKQAHISNFLNKKRGFSLEGMDQVLNVQHLSVLDLLDPAEVNLRATILPPSEDDFENIPLTDPLVAATRPQISGAQVKDFHKFKKTFLDKLRADPAVDRPAWRRFVLLKASPVDATAMHPRLTPGTLVLLDRHYTSFAPYHKGQPNLYAVWHGGACAIRYVEPSGDDLILRPHARSSPVEVVSASDRKPTESQIVGRVCHVSSEV